MDTAASISTFCFLLAIRISCSSGSLHILVKDFKQNELGMKDEHTLHISRKGLVGNIRHDFTNPSVTPYPTTPITNPVTAPPITNPVTTPATATVPPSTSSPVTVTIPSVNPVPITNPANPTMPITNPVTTPSTTYNNPVGQPVTNINPGTTYPNPTVPVTTPVVAQPVTTTNAPAVPGQSWCVARSGVAETDVQAALDYACGIGGADCAAIQQGGSCYNPNTMQNHASYAFNSYYQRNPVQTSCDFGATAFITNMNPSSGSCIYHTWSSSSALPNSVAPPITTNPTTSPTTVPASSGATPVSSGTPPVIFPTGTPALGGAATGYSEMPPMANTSSTSMSNGLQPFIGYVAMMTSLITWKLILDL
ncbi:uncharacterized protein [Primulina huaijiensis]|uniref:uncharacterized protein n=1 Tax=Primulina huaijiensis TaxID=1492673 RepID=UPI003CC74B8B